MSVPVLPQQAWRFAATVLLLLGVLSVHWPPARVDFLFDDDDFVVYNPAAHSVAAAARAVLLPFPPDQPGRGLYRPLTALSYGLDFSLGGGTARAFALTNLLLYLAVTLLAWGFFSRHLPRAPAAFVAALLFAAHPVHAEAVDAVAGRSELLALLFSLIALQLFAQAPEPELVMTPDAARPRLTPWRAWSSALAFALACGAKESAAILPAVLAADLAILRLEGRLARGEASRRLRLLLPHVLVLGAYLAVRSHALGGFTPARRVLGDADGVTRFFTMGAVFAEDLRLLLFPVTLQADGYYLNKVGILHSLTWQSACGWGAVAGLLSLAVVLALRLARPAHRAAVAGAPTAEGAALRGLALFFGFLLPVSHIAPIGALMAERFLFSPSLGFVLAATAAVVLVSQGRAARRFPGAVLTIGLVGALAVFGAWRSHARSLDWRDAVRFWESEARATPGDFRVQVNLGAERLQRRDLGGATTALQSALAVRPDAVEPVFDLALIAAQRGELAEASALLEQVLEREPDNAAALVELAAVEIGRGDRARASALAARARSRAPARPDLRQRLLAIEQALAR